MADSDEYLDSNLSQDDYERLFTISWTWLGAVFLVILITLSSLLYWFVTSMRANSNVRVNEAVAMIEKYDNSADTRSTEVSPLTLELEEMRINMEEDRRFITKTLIQDSYPRKMNERLRTRFLRQSFYTDLPEDWKQNLPEQLREYKREQDSQHVAELRYRLSRVPPLIESNRERLERLEEIRKNMDLSDTFSRMLDGYKRTRDRFQTRIRNLESAMSDIDTSTFTRRRLPGDLFRAMARMLDPISMMGLQMRRFSGLSSREASLVYAEQTLRDAERIDPKNPRVLYHLGRVYEKLGMGNVSNGHYLKALRVARGQDFERRDDIVSMFENVLENNPNSPRAHYDVAFAYYETNRKPEAFGHLLRVLENDCSLGRLNGIQNAYDNGNHKRAMALVDAVTARKCGERSMVRTLAKKRIEYILEGEPPYYRLTYF